MLIRRGEGRWGGGHIHTVVNVTSCHRIIAPEMRPPLLRPPRCHAHVMLSSSFCSQVSIERAPQRSIICISVQIIFPMTRVAAASLLLLLLTAVLSSVATAQLAPSSLAPAPWALTPYDIGVTAASLSCSGGLCSASVTFSGSVISTLEWTTDTCSRSSSLLCSGRGTTSGSCSTSTCSYSFTLPGTAAPNPSSFFNVQLRAPAVKAGYYTSRPPVILAATTNAVTPNAVASIALGMPFTVALALIVFG